MFGKLWKTQRVSVESKYMAEKKSVFSFKKEKYMTLEIFIYWCIFVQGGNVNSEQF